METTQTATTTPTKTAPLRETAGVSSLDDLSALDVEALERLYRRGTVPANLTPLEGHPRARMLAVRGLDREPLLTALRTFARSPLFPWAGKSFRTTGDTEATGVNRIRLFGIRRWFPFGLRVEPSAIDGAPCIRLDYGRPGNPWPIRNIRDELREVSPGLFLGPALMGDRTLLYFACDAR